MDPSDNYSLITRFQEGDKNALEEIYWQYCEPLHDLAKLYLKDEQLAEDAVHDVFISLWNNRLNLDKERSIKGLLFTSLKNHVLNIIKSHKRRILRQFEYVTNNRNSEENSDDSVILADYRAILEESLQKIPATKRSVFELKSFGGFSNNEVADHLGISINTVKSHYFHARKTIRHIITTYDKLP